MSTSKAVTDATFKAEVLDSDLPVLVDFWAEWCPPCRMMSPIVDEIGTELAGKLKVVKIDTDMNPKTARAYGITSIPTFNVYKNGELVRSIVGGRAKRQFLQEINAVL